MSDFPPAVWFPSPNKSGRGGLQPVAIVDHIAEGFRAGMRSVVLNEGKSAHYLVCRSGEVEQYVAEAEAAWANGLDFSKGYDTYKSDLTIPWLAECYERRINPNRVTISIEHEGFTGEPLTPAQLATSIELHRDICRRWDIRPTGQTIVGHYRIDAVTRPNDPGPLFPWAELLDALAGELNPPAPPAGLPESIRDELDRLWEHGNLLTTLGEQVRQEVIKIKQATGFAD
ncbi:MAG: N-acetylmuramoyl-L-alanine amidase [Chloroflexota bacterium]